MGSDVGLVKRGKAARLLSRCLLLAGAGLLLTGSVRAQEPVSPLSAQPLPGYTAAPPPIAEAAPGEVPLTPPPVAPSPPAASGPLAGLVELTSAPGAEPNKTDPPKYPTVRLTGFFHLDWLYASQSTANRLTVGNAQDSLTFRRARIAAVGELVENITYILEFDFAASQPRFVDDWVNFAKVPLVGNVRVGRFRQPFGMTEMTLVRDLPFLERASMFALSPFRQTGVMVFDALYDERATYALSGYRYNTDPFGNVFASSGGYGLAARLTGLPLYEDDHRLVHVGGDYSYNRPDDPNLIRFQSTPEVFAGDTTGNVLAPEVFNLPPFVDTGAIQVDSTNLFNVEAAALYDNFMVQSEARWAVVDQGAAGGTTTLPAFYAQARWVLTGEKYTYNKAYGVVERVRPARPVYKGGCGAWELALRYSYIDLNGTTPLPGRDGGPGRWLNDFTVGVNWYLIDNAKFQFNYIHAAVNDRVTGGTNADFFALRCQIDF